MNEKSYSPAQAAKIAGIGRSTIQRAVDDGDLSAFKTPGGHTRIPAASLDAFMNQNLSSGRAAASTPLNHRREILESKKLRLQEAAVDEELREIREDKRARAKERRREKARIERQQEIRLREQENEARRIELTAEESRRREDRKLRESQFRRRWTDRCFSACSAASTSPASVFDIPAGDWLRLREARTELLGRHDTDWLESSQRKQIFEALRAEVERHQPEEEEVIALHLRAVAEPLVQKFEHHHQVQLMRQSEAEAIIKNLPIGASDFERGRVREAVREQLSEIPAAADREEVRLRLNRATAAIRRKISGRLETLKLNSQRDQLVRTFTTLGGSIRQELRSLYNEGEIDEDLSDDEDTVEEARIELKRYLTSELSGDESLQEVDEIVREFVADWAEENVLSN